MVLEKDFEETEISFSDPDALAKAVVEKISTAESELQVGRGFCFAVGGCRFVLKGGLQQNIWDYFPTRTIIFWGKYFVSYVPKIWEIDRK